jgi:hypothetical protein
MALSRTFLSTHQYVPHDGRGLLTGMSQLFSERHRSGLFGSIIWFSTGFTLVSRFTDGGRHL